MIHGPDRRPCSECGGSGFVPCPVCGGFPVRDPASLDTVLNCERCRGAGTVLCGACRGLGEVPREAEAKPANDGGQTEEAG